MSNRPRGRGGRGGNRPNLSFELFLEGPRANVEVTIRLFEGQTPKTGTTIGFFLGTENNPFKVVLNHADGRPMAIQINDLGFASTKLNLSNFAPDKFTTLTAIAGSRSTPPKPLPVEIKVPGAVAGGKRIKVIPGDEKLDTTTNHIVLRVQSVQPDGNPEPNAGIRVASSTEIQVNGVAGRQLDVNTDGHGWLDLDITSSGFETSFTIIHLASGESHSKRLCFK
ncbi:MAG: hypothetical protein ACM3KM_00935 [Acidobacteriaceae bacterium]